MSRTVNNLEQAPQILKDYVFLEWVDSSETTGWQALSESVQEEPETIKTVAILLRKPIKKDPFWIICRDLSEKVDRCMGLLRIPQAAVLKSHIVKWPKNLRTWIH